jgi:hypothetical protein
LEAFVEVIELCAMQVVFLVPACEDRLQQRGVDELEKDCFQKVELTVDVVVVE